jgi:hypothetical protein
MDGGAVVSGWMYFPDGLEDVVLCDAFHVSSVTLSYCRAMTPSAVLI